MLETGPSASQGERSPWRRRLSFVAGTAAQIAVLAVVSVACLGLPSLSRAQVAVPFSASPQFTNTSQVASYVVDLESLPLRPEVVVQAVPDATHGNLQIEIVITDFQLGADTPGQDFCPFPTDSIVSPPGSGPAKATWQAWRCQPKIDDLIGDSARVDVRVLAFGSGGSPATVHLGLRGVTTVPNSSQLIPYFPPGVPTTITIPATKDTTVYERDPSGSNGAGQFMWAGRDVNTVSPLTPYRVRSLLSFDLRFSPIPDTATVNSAELRLDVESILGSGNSLSVWSMGFEGRWDQGNADAAGNEFQSGTSSTRAANWDHKGLPDFSWFAPGGSPEDLLATQAITTTGIKTFTGALLRDSVDSLLDDFLNQSGYQDGFVLRGPESSAASSGVQIASRENAGVGANAPVLLVTVTQPAGAQEDLSQAGVVTFINEGQNLRWIYDLDHDDVYTTPVNGVCTVTAPGGNFMPYSYRFNGTPGFTGHDCCTWHLDSPLTGTLGTGQLIFFHNLDAGNPANMPPDTDLDGIRDLCDNCVLKANGPLLGSCLTGPSAGAPCRSNPECTSGICSLSQEDANGDKTGDACVPEPGMALMLAAGVIALAGTRTGVNARTARTGRRPQSSPSRLPAARSAASATSRSGSLASQRR